MIFSKIVRSVSREILNIESCETQTVILPWIEISRLDLSRFRFLYSASPEAQSEVDNTKRNMPSRMFVSNKRS